MGEATPRRTGLGRGLQALLPNAGDHPQARDAADWLVTVDDGTAPRLSALVEAGLDVLERAIDVDVCGYVHGRDRERPRLWLRPGQRAAVGPAEWVDLGLAVAGGIIGPLRTPRTLNLGRTELLAVPTRGGTSAGVHVLGRSARPLDDHERTVAIHLVQALGEALHGLLPAPEAALDPAPASPPVAVTVRWPAPVDLQLVGVDLEREEQLAAV